MKRDMDQAAIAANSRAESAAAYQQLCVTGKSVSAATCEAMRREIGPQATATPPRPAPTPPAVAVPQPPPPVAVARASVPPNWGGLETLVGRTYQRRITTASRMASDTNSTSHSFRWETPGEVLVDDFVAPHGVYKFRYTIDPATNTVAGWIVEPDGSLVTKGAVTEMGTLRQMKRVVGNTYEEHTQVLKGGRWRTILMGKEVFETAQAVQQRQADRSAMFGTLMQGVAIAGVAASGGDVSSVPLNGNPLETLNAAGALVGQREAESRERLNATIADAQAQAAQQRQAQQQAQQRQNQAPPSAARVAAPAASAAQAAAGRPSPAGGAIVVSQTPAPKAQPGPPTPVSRPAPPKPDSVASPAPSRALSYPPRTCSTTTTQQSRTANYPFMSANTKTYQAEGRAEMVENVQRACEGGVMKTYSCKGGGAFGIFNCQVNFSCPVKQTKCTGGPPASKVSAQ